ncbi:MAG: GNAT family N-acetyltransferase [Deltaproteobacteria bacterium]|nr:MAG: GNAT family N-acetyltransferase [Deltaproteobacteria bacterium]
MDTARKRRFDDNYRELARTKDGREVLFRLIRPSDKAGLLDGLSRMSLESRYKRFFTPRDSFSEDELAYLTELDQERHFAIVVGLTGGGDDMTVGLGVGRFVCDADDPKSAEAAVAVVDEAQGLGLGRMLFERLINAARERGLESFHLDILPENASMLGLMQRLFPTADAYPDSEVVLLKCPIPAAPHTPEFPFFRVLSEAARGTLRVIRAFRNWPLPDGLVDGILENSPKPDEIIQDKGDRE